MKKILLIFIVILISSCLCACSQKEEFLREYILIDGGVSWGGIKLGVDSQDEALEKLKSLELFNPKKIEKQEYFMYGGSGIMVNTFPGPLRFHVIEDEQGNVIVVGLVYSVFFKPEEVFNYLSEPEKVFVGVGTHGLDGRKIVLINRTCGYILVGNTDVRNYEDERFLLKSNQKFILYLFSPDYYDLYIEKVLFEYLGEFSQEGDFQEWQGYTEYDVFFPWE